MTDFSTLETSVESSQPLELYQFVLGSETFRFTSSEDDLLVDSNTWTAIPIYRGRLVQGADAERSSLSVSLPGVEAFPRKFIVTAPAARCSFSLYRYQRNESPSFDTQVLLYQGFVQSAKFTDDGHTAELTIKALEAALGRNIPRFGYMGLCNHFLYDSNCGVNPSSFDYTGEVTLVDGFDITVSGLSGAGLDFVGGYARPTGENDFRTVYAQSGDVLTLNVPFANDQTGNNLQVFAGCDHLVDGDCALVFDNVERFGGFPWVPTDDVFRSGIIV